MRLVLPNIGNDAVPSSPPPRARAGIRATVLLLVAGQTERLAGAFTSSPVRTLPGLHRPTTRLHVTIDPDDKYATLLQNYQKKKVVVDAAPKITPPEPFAPESVRGAEERLLGLPSTSSDDLGAAASASAPSSSTSADLAAARAAEEAAARTAKAAEEAAAAAARAAEEASAKVTEAASASSAASAAATKSGGAVAATKGGGGAAAAGTKSISAKVAAGAQAKASAAAAAAGTTVPAPEKVPTLGEFLKQNVGETESISAKIAAGVKAKSAASAATSAAAGAATGRAPTLADYVKDKLTNAEMPSKEDLERLTIPNPAPETLANAQEKLGIMKQNLMNELPKVDLPKVDLPDLPKTAVSVTDVASSGGVSGGDVAAQVKAAAAAAFAAAAGAGDGAAVGSAVSDLVATLHLKEYGGWYVAALAALFGASQRSAREEARMRYETELRSLQEKADEAASAAERAAEGARRAKEMVLEKSEGGVLKLQTAERAGTILGKTKMEELQVEREMMRKEMQQLKKDNVQLKAQLDRLFAAQEIADPLFDSDFDDEDEEIYDEHMTGDADEDYGNGRILAAMEEIENANTAAQDEAEKVRAQAKEDEMKLKAQIKAREEAAAAAAKESKGTRSKKSTKASSGEVKVPAKISHAANNVHPWASLAPSTLGRKTVKELSGFLQEKGVPAVDDSGKPFRKKELLDKVKSLL